MLKPRAVVGVIVLVLSLGVLSAAAGTPAPPVTIPEPTTLVVPRDSQVTPTPKQKKRHDADDVSPDDVLRDRLEPLIPSITGLLVLVAALVAWGLVRNLRRVRVDRRRRERVLGEAAEPETLAETVATDLERTVTTMQADGVHDLIIACWRQLEDVGASSGLPRLVSQTSTEYTQAWIASLGADAASARALGELYREAQFSTHRLDEADRERAEAAVAAVVAGLRARR